MAIAVIALLMAILVASPQASRQQAKAVLCGSNVRQLVLGLALYETENQTFPHAFDDTVLEPPPGGYPGNPAYDMMGWWWFSRITDYSRNEPPGASILWCPSRELRDPRLRLHVLCGNYGVNQSICKSSSAIASHGEFFGTPLCAVDVWHPSRTLLIVDSGYSVINWRHATNAPLTPLGSMREDKAYVPGLWINKVKDVWPGQERDAIDGRHPNRTVNVGFADGHTDRMKADELFVEKAGGSYRNQHPLWVPR